MQFLLAQVALSGTHPTERTHSDQSSLEGKESNVVLYPLGLFQLQQKSHVDCSFAGVNRTCGGCWRPPWHRQARSGIFASRWKTRAGLASSAPAAVQAISLGIWSLVIQGHNGQLSQHGNLPEATARRYFITLPLGSMACMIFKHASRES